MAKRSRPLASLDAEKAIHRNLERQKKFQKRATRRKRSNQHYPLTNGVEPLMSGALQPEEDDDDESKGVHGLADLTTKIDSTPVVEDDSTSDSKISHLQARDSDLQSIAQSKVDDRDDSEALGSNAETDEAIEEVEGEEEGIPFSELESASEDEQGDIVPYQRLTINNTTALTKAYKSIALPLTHMPFSEHQVVISTEPISIQDVDDDLNRELAFHKQCLDASMEAKLLLQKEGVAFSRPADYFAEMIKSDEHMGKIKKRMTDEAADKKAAADARKLRDLKKFGKQVQIAKLQARDKAKRETLDKINALKCKRKNNEEDGADETKLFDVALADASISHKAARGSRMGGTSSKRQRKEDKFGFGGKKRFAKSGDAVSTSDLKAFPIKKVKGQKNAPRRLGKSRRAQK
ncbi:MAG: hypothetical protein Q9222_002182 [Ikaeria aurantiellina]